MGFWKNFGLFKMFTAKTPGQLATGAYIYETDKEIQKQKQLRENKDENIKINFAICRNCGAKVNEYDEFCSNCGTSFKNNNYSDVKNKSEQNALLYSDELLVDLSDYNFYHLKQYKVGKDIEAGEYLYFCPYGNGCYEISTEKDNSDFETPPKECYGIMSAFFRLERGLFLTINDGYLINVSDLGKIKYENINGSYAYRIGIDIEPGTYNFTVKEDCSSVGCAIYNCPPPIMNKNFYETQDNQLQDIYITDSKIIDLPNQTYLYITGFCNIKKKLSESIYDDTFSNIITKQNTDFNKIKKYSDGQYLVSEDLQPGEYLFYSPTGIGHFSMTTDANGENIVEIGNNIMSCFINLSSNLYIYIQEGYLISTLDLPALDYNEILGKTIYRVGLDLLEGIYKIKNLNNKDNYYCVYNHSFDGNTDIISNGIFRGSKYVELRNGDYFAIDKDIEIIERKDLPDNNDADKESLSRQNKVNEFCQKYKDLPYNFIIYIEPKIIKFDDNSITKIEYKPYLNSKATAEEKKELLSYYKQRFLNKVLDNHEIINIDIYEYNNEFLIMFDVKCNSCNRIHRLTALDKIPLCKCDELRRCDWNIIKENSIYSSYSEFIKNEKFNPNERYFIVDSTKTISNNNIFKGTYTEYLHNKNVIKNKGNGFCMNCGVKIDEKKQCHICNAIIYNEDDIRYELISKRLYEKDDIDNTWEKNIVPYEISYHSNYSPAFFVNVFSEHNLKYYYLDDNKLSRMGLYKINFLDNNCVIADYVFYINKQGYLKFENIYKYLKNDLYEPIIRYYIDDKWINPENKLLNSKKMIKMKLLYFTKNENSQDFILNVYENDTLINKIENIKNVIKNVVDKRLLLEFDNNQKKYYDIDSNEVIESDFDEKMSVYDFSDLNTNITYNFTKKFLNNSIEELLRKYKKEDNETTKLIYISKSVYKDNYVLFEYLKEKFKLQLLENEFENDKTKNYIAKVDRENKDSISFIEYIISKTKSREARDSINYLIYGVPLKYITASIFSKPDLKEKLVDLIKNDILLVSDKNKKERLINRIYMSYPVKNDIYTKICNQLLNKYKVDEISLIIILLYKYGEELVFNLPNIENITYNLSKYSVSVINNSNNEKNKELYEEIYINSSIDQIKWKSEFTMFKLIKDYFSDAIYQYRCKELGLQSLDVYIPSIKFGFEYQGQQHYEPIEVFGGLAHFEKQKENDKNKKEICKNNGITLIEWKYTESINKFVLDQKLNDYKDRLEGKYKFND